MDALIAAITWLLQGFFNAASIVVGVIVSAFAWPAGALGIPAEILAAAVLCVVLLALWRAMGGYFT